MSKKKVRLEPKTDRHAEVSPTDLSRILPAAEPEEEVELSTNDQVVLEVLQRVGYASRGDLVKLCALPRTTIYDALMRLERYGLVKTFSETRSTRGRPKTFFQIPKMG